MACAWASQYNLYIFIIKPALCRRVKKDVKKYRNVILFSPEVPVYERIIEI